MSLKAVVFDFGHTIMREDSCTDPHLQDCPIDLMPGAGEAIEAIDAMSLPIGIWANTRLATTDHLRRWLARAGLDHRISFIATSVELGFRKPAPEFFIRALAACGLNSHDVLFVGNQLDSDIAGANRLEIPCVYLGDARYRSVDERHVDARPTYIIETLFQLPQLVAAL